MTASTIVPFVSSWHGGFLAAAAEGARLPWIISCKVDEEALRMGQMLVDSDECCSALIATAQAFSAIEESRCADAVAGIFKTCFGCRTGELSFLIRRGLAGAGATISVNDLLWGFARSSAVPEAAQRRLAAALVVGDVLLRAKCQANDEKHLAFVEQQVVKVLRALRSYEAFDARGYLLEFDAGLHALSMRLTDDIRPAVGMAGSALALYCGGLNARIVASLESEGCQVIMPPLSMMLEYVHQENGIRSPFSCELEALGRFVAQSIVAVQIYPLLDELRDASDFLTPREYRHGLGWLTDAWMRFLVRGGVGNIIYVNTFGCLSGHVVGRGVLKSLRADAPNLNVASVEFDPGTSEVNQLNRVKLFASIAKRNHERG